MTVASDISGATAGEGTLQGTLAALARQKFVLFYLFATQIIEITNHLYEIIGKKWQGDLTETIRLGANGRNNSQHCCADNVGSCWVRVSSGVQTDATTPNKFGTCSASWEEYNP